MQPLGLSGHDMKCHPRMAAGESIDDGGYEARGQKGVASDPYFASRGVSEKFDILNALTQFVEYGHSAIHAGCTGVHATK